METSVVCMIVRADPPHHIVHTNASIHLMLGHRFQPTAKMRLDEVFIVTDELSDALKSRRSSSELTKIQDEFTDMLAIVQVSCE